LSPNSINGLVLDGVPLQPDWSADQSLAAAPTDQQAADPDTVSDRTDVIDKVFADLAHDGDNFGDFGD
jgi:hypothetical protein